ncbi:hypothetical protein N7462_009120 [Penicillium macrosclerotiorum]|uniref:uncharacterized protein n=1 Tax=Penicillium macrosclerotiorum TaxID=303699 RepID=UPI00254697B5|nr:uncharacterized protein N7462_009120 [Penicillium macrosclerotiorum]KAJ5676223.1 hypothetical protein N7462_009120 [Penicillium macrosclerotiorum]
MPLFNDKEENFAPDDDSNGEVILHTDVGHIVSLFTLGEPASDGESLLASGIGERLVNFQVCKTDLSARRTLLGLNHSVHPGIFHSRPLLYHQCSSSGAPERIVLQFSRCSFSGFGVQPRQASWDLSKKRCWTHSTFPLKCFRSPGYSIKATYSL